MNGFFPSRTITLYMGRSFLIATFGIMFALVLVLQSLDLLGESGKIFEFKGNGTPEILTYLSLRLPQLIQFVLPFAVLLGTLLTLMTMNQNSEIVSMKGAGLSAHQVLAPLFVAALLVAGISFVFNERIVVRSTATLDAWKRVQYGIIPPDTRAKTNIWVRDGDNLIHAKSVSGTGDATTLSKVTIYNRDGGELRSILRSDTGRRVASGWQLPAVSQFDVASGTQTALGLLTVGTTIRPDQFTLADVNADRLTFGELSGAIDDLKRAGRPTGALEAGLWHKISGPLSALLMPLLGAVAAFGVARSGKLFIRAVIGMALGFAFFVADNFGLAMSSIGAYPPLLAAWGPFALFLLIGEAVLVQTEE